MRQRSVAFVAMAILLLLLVPVAYSIGSGGSLASIGEVQTLSTSPNYQESISLYLTSAESFWQAGFSGGNISISTLSIPSSVSSFSITLTHYQNWNSQFEIFTKNGFGLLGSSEPLPDGAVLTVNTTSGADAATLASSLDQIFALVFSPTSSSNSSFSFVSPINFQTELHVYFWKLVPISYHGFASQFSESQLETSDLGFYKISYSAGIYSISVGGLRPLVSTAFSLYTQLGTSENFTYSSLASSSSVSVHVLGGLISQSNTTFTNHLNNFSASMFEGSSGGKSAKVPNLNATLDFSFPTIVATRAITTLNPTSGENDTVLITINNIGASGSPTANDVSVNDSWVYSQTSDFKISQGHAFGEQNLSSGQSMTVPYAFTVLPGAKNYTIPPVPVNYNFKLGNKTLTSQVFLNTETLTINGIGPAIEAVARVSSGAFQAGQAISANITITNKGSNTAFNLQAGGQTKPSLLQGQSWSFLSSSPIFPLTQTNATVSYTVTWQDASHVTKTEESNTLGLVFSFASPGSPASSLSKSVIFFKNSATVNVTLTLTDNSGTPISNLTLGDSIPQGMTFAKSYNASSLRFSGGLVTGNVSTLAGNAKLNFTYVLGVSNVNENYVFLPANVSSVWNNLTVVHFSQGVGFALGVSVSKAISPSSGFQGSAVGVQIGVVNKGSLPVYDVSLASSADTFLTLSGKGGSFKNVLPPGSSINSTLNGNLTGLPGSYNSSSGSASFIFAGSNQSSTSAPVSVNVFQDVQSKITVLSSKIEEDHNIEIQFEVTNPSNVAVSNVSYSSILPSDLKLVSGSETFQISTLAPGGSYKNNVTLTTNLPQTYDLSGGTLRFQYNGQTLQGQTTGLTLSITDDLTLRYGIPVLIGLVIVLLTLFYVRRLVRQPKA